MTMPPSTADHDPLYGSSGADDDFRPIEDGVRAWLREHALALFLVAAIALFTFVVFWPRMVITIRPGEAGVLWSRFVGTRIDTVFGEGTHLIAPWDVMYIYDVRISKVDYTVPVLSTDGLDIEVEVSVRYRPVSKSVPQLHQQIGPDYVQRIIIPEVVTAVREVMGRYRPDQLLALRTIEMQTQIVTKASAQVRDRFVVIDDVLIRRIKLPARVQTAIEDKLKQEQASLSTSTASRGKRKRRPARKSRRTASRNSPGG